MPVVPRVRSPLGGGRIFGARPWNWSLHAMGMRTATTAAIRRVLITGSHVWTDRTAIWMALNQELLTYDGTVVIVHGGCPTGADDIADRWAYGQAQMGWPVQVEKHAPDYETFGKRATLVRNQEMAESGIAVCHAFPLQGSTDTRHAMTRCLAAGVRVTNHGYLPYTTQAFEFAGAFG